MSENPELNTPLTPSTGSGAGFTEEIATKLAAEPHRGMKGLEAIDKNAGAQSMDMLWNVHLTLSVELGRTSLTVRQVIDLQKGSVIELDRIAGEAVDIYANDRLIAKGDVVVVDDKFGVRITELISPAQED
ncbi:MAG: flagellar motor switch protein FliN [Anaerolineae bacterium]|nr:flagellar motor switch protein FliN [Anaerolineae bacterium]